MLKNVRWAIVMLPEKMLIGRNDTDDSVSKTMCTVFFILINYMLYYKQCVVVIQRPCMLSNSFHIFCESEMLWILHVISRPQTIKIYEGM